MRPLSESLTVLIATAEDLVRRPQQSWSALTSTGFADLATEIRAADARPAEGVRSTRAAVIMITAIEARADSFADDLSWQMLIGAALPLLRREAWQALNSERGAAQGEGGYRR